MKIKTDWFKSLHNLKNAETSRIFHNCPPKLFMNGLELGAGDGFQSKLISKYIEKLISADYNLSRLQEKSTSTIKYIKCDAEETDRYFTKKKFDIIFSSNLLEHVPHPGKALSGMCQILKDDGIMIHIMPNVFWKFSQITMFYPNLFIEIVERILTPNRLISAIKKRLKKRSNILKTETEFDNNPKSSQHNYSWLWPCPHGAYKSHWDEFLAFRKKRWLALFKSEGLNVIKVMKGPVCSGYGFGLERLRKLFKTIGLSSSYTYITVKENHSSPNIKFFL